MQKTNTSMQMFCLDMFQEKKKNNHDGWQMPQGNICILPVTITLPQHRADGDGLSADQQSMAQSEFKKMTCRANSGSYGKDGNQRFGSLTRKLVLVQQQLIYHTPLRGT